MSQLIDINQKEDIPENYNNTPIGLLLEYQNLKKPFENVSTAQLLIGMCMDNRKHIPLPDNYAFIIRDGGANLQHSEFKVSYAIAVGGIKHIAIIGHTNCGMVNLEERKEQFLSGLIENAGWDKKSAEEHYVKFAPQFEIGNEVDFVLSEVKRLRKQYPIIMVAPLLYKVEDNRLYMIKE